MLTRTGLGEQSSAIRFPATHKQNARRNSRYKSMGALPVPEDNKVLNKDSVWTVRKDHSVDKTERNFLKDCCMFSVGHQQVNDIPDWKVPKTAI